MITGWRMMVVFIHTKQQTQQCSFLNNAWNVLSTELREKVMNGIHGIIRSMIPLIPEDLCQMLCVEGDNHRPALFIPHQLMAMVYIKTVHISEEFFLEHIHTDGAMQYALMTENESHQPFSDRVFSRLRAKLREIYSRVNRDLLQEVTDIVNGEIEMEIFKDMPYSELYDRVYRMDSLNIDMHAAHMTRLQLIYVVTRMNVVLVKECRGKDCIPESLLHYLEENDHHRITYYKGTLEELQQELINRGISIDEAEKELDAADKAKNKSGANSEAASNETGTTESKADPSGATGSEQKSGKKAARTAEDNRKRRVRLIGRLRLATAVEEALQVLKLMTDLGLADSDEGKLLQEVISNQTKLNEKGEVIPRENYEIDGNSCQSPYEPGPDGATCRTKDNKTTQGYSAQVVQRVGEKGGYPVIVNWDVKPNTYSDQNYARAFYDQFGRADFDPKKDKYTVVCCDGLYCNSLELRTYAMSRAIIPVCGTLTGYGYDELTQGFQVNLDGHTVTECPAGKAVEMVNWNEVKGTVRLHVPGGECATCPHRDTCGASILKNGTGSLQLKLSRYAESQTMHDMGEETFREFVNKRNGVEGVPSVLRRAYDIDDVPYFGIWYARYTVCLSVTAMNLRTLLRFRQDKIRAEKEKEETKKSAA